MKANERTIDTILRSARLHAYVIPPYQREYRWKAERWEMLLDDIQQNSPGYFIGALIFIRATNDDHGLQEFNVVDGQQRLATLTIVLSAIYRAIRERIEHTDRQKQRLLAKREKHEEKIKGLSKTVESLEARGDVSDRDIATIAKSKLEIKERQDEMQANNKQISECRRDYEELIGTKKLIEEMLVINDSDHGLRDRPRLKLSYQKRDNEHYEAVLKFSGVFNRDDPLESLPSSLGETARHNIGKCFQFFYGTVSKKKGLSNTEVVQLYKKVADLLIVDIKADNSSDAYVLFESLNNRGEPLTGLDLIKNSILAKIDDDSRLSDRRFTLSLEQASEKWQDFIRHLALPKDQDKFLRHLYLAFKLKLPQFRIDGVDRVTAQTVVGDVFPRLAERNAQTLLEHFHQKAAIYGQLVNPDPSRVPETRLRRALVNLVQIEAVPARILLLFLLSEFRTDREKLIPQIADLVSRFFIRRHLTDYPKGRELDDIFVELTEDIARRSRDVSLDEIRNTVEATLGKFIGPIHDVLPALREDMVKAAFARAILVRVEAQHYDPDAVPDLWAVDADGRQTLTLEHILPQGELSGVSWWCNELAGGRVDEAAEIQDKVVQKLGNLTLTGFNPELSNKPFPEKRDYARGGKNLGYRNGLRINSTLIDKVTWGPNEIQERTELLIRLLVPSLLFGSETIPDYSAQSAEPINLPDPE